jgi:hypothetical protein
MTSFTHEVVQPVRQQSGVFAQTWATQRAMPSQPMLSAAPVLHSLCAQLPIAGPSHVAHDELMHVALPMHMVPHVPQLESSVVVSLHWPAQHVFVPHATPHVPQF